MNTQDDLQIRWRKLEEKFTEKFNKTPDVETILFLVGIQEVRNTKKEFTKEEKEDLMHVAVCTVLSQSDYYKLEKYDKEGWPHFTILKQLPKYNAIEQENFLKDHILLYFENIGEPLKNV
ncbi:MAG: hypothetical protein ABI237_17980 [Ginsengibacter sp.]